MTDLHVGQWVRRERGVRVVSSDSTGLVEHIPLTKGHYVESVVAGDAITRCGRRMRHLTRPRLTIHQGSVSRAGRPMDWDLCEAGC